MSNICFIDFETTGLLPEVHSPLQLGAVLAEEETLLQLDVFSQYIMPPIGCVVDDKAMEVNGLDINNMPEDTVSQWVCLNSFFLKFGYDYCFAAWNMSFDVSFFRRMCIQSARMQDFNKLDYHHIDVQSIVKFLRLSGRLPSNVTSFNAALKHFGLERSYKTHDGFEDACLLRDLYISLKQYMYKGF